MKNIIEEKFFKQVEKIQLNEAAYDRNRDKYVHDYFEMWCIESCIL